MTELDVDEKQPSLFLYYLQNYIKKNENGRIMKEFRTRYKVFGYYSI